MSFHRRVVVLAGLLLAGLVAGLWLVPGTEPRPLRDGAVTVPAIGPLETLPAAEHPGAAPIVDASASPAALAQAVAAHAQDLWARAFAQAGRRYRPARLVVLRGRHRAPACRQLGTGPSYCPLTETLYIDVAFLTRLRERFGAHATVAQSYVVAHELAHHVQELAGVHAGIGRRAMAAPQSADWLAGREELQADCLAGVWIAWAHRSAPLTAQDRRAALMTARAIGDDRLRDTGAWPEPAAWTHGSGAERGRWLARGMRTGDPRHCDPFR